MITHSHDTCIPYSNIKPATEKDNAEILEFLQNVSMKLKEGNLDFTREPGFFELNKLQGMASTTFIFRNKNGQMSGIGVITSVKGIYQGKEIVWAYTSELRFSPDMDRATKAQFRPWYSDIVKNCRYFEDLHCPQYILSIVLDDNEVAKKTLLNRKNPVVYRPVHQYQTRAIVGKLPSLNSGKYRVSFCKEEDRAELISLLMDAQNNTNFTHSLDDIKNKLEILDQSWSDFLIAREHAGRIIGAGLLTSDNKFRQPRLNFEGSPKLKKLNLVLRFFGRPAIESNARLNTSMLAFLTFSSWLTVTEKEEAKRDLLRKAWRKTSRDNHALIYSEEITFDRKASLKYGFLSEKVPGTIYQIIHRDDYKKMNLLRGLDKKHMHMETSFL